MGDVAFEFAQREAALNEFSVLHGTSPVKATSALYGVPLPYERQLDQFGQPRLRSSTTTASATPMMSWITCTHATRHALWMLALASILGASNSSCRRFVISMWLLHVDWK